MVRRPFVVFCPSTSSNISDETAWPIKAKFVFIDWVFVMGEGQTYLLYSLIGGGGRTNVTYLLAHLSRRLIGELIGYSWSGVRPSSIVVVHNAQRSSSPKPLGQSKPNLCGASLGRGNESLFTASGSHDQDGRHAHIW